MKCIKSGWGNLTPAIIVLSFILPFFNCSDLLVTAGIFVLKFAIFLEKGKLLIYMYGYGNHCDAVVAMATIFIVFHSCVSVKLL